MNRRKFLKFLGKAALVTGIALVAGLPEVPEDISTAIGLDEYAKLLGFYVPPGFPNDVYPLRLSNNENIWANANIDPIIPWDQVPPLGNKFTSS